MGITEFPDDPSSGLLERFLQWRNSLAGSRKFQSWAARFPLVKRIARRDGERLFDLVAGFSYSQVLQAFVAFDLAEHLKNGPRTAADLAMRCDIPVQRMTVLCQAAAGLELMRRGKDGRYSLARLGAAVPAVPGLRDMILHHDVLYRDLKDPVAFFRGETETELAGFWPYVFGASGEVDPEVALRYSQLMSDSQVLVAEETLKAVDFSSCQKLLDIGGGTGAFLSAAGVANPDLTLELFDLPEVAPHAQARFERDGLAERATISTGSFRKDSLPSGANTISLVRVLYDHQDETVLDLLAKVFAALPENGSVVISEPMSGGDKPDRAADAYFSVYCMAMRTGCVRSAARISQMLRQAGFSEITERGTDRPFICRVVTARKLSNPSDKTVNNV